jgi:hypothetical protein
MVQAILAGTKTQTRRVIKQNSTVLNWLNAGFTPEFILAQGNEAIRKYNVGDVLWVRETWQKVHGIINGEQIKYAYRADGVGWGDYEITKWKPSIFMPREAARIFLRVTDIRIERLQDISEEDAVAEGIEMIEGNIHTSPVFRNYLQGGVENGYGYPTNSFQSLWKSINGEQSWNDSPYVFVISFGRIMYG